MTLGLAAPQTLRHPGRLLPGPGFGLAAAGSWRRGQVEVELRQATGGLGHAGLGRQKKSQKKVKCAYPSLGGLLEATKVKKNVKSGKRPKKKKVKKQSKKSKKKSRKKSQKKVEKSQKKSNVKTKRGS